MADYGSARKKKGCVNLSLRDSGTKSRKFLRVLLTFALAFALLVTTGVVALAEENGTATGELEKFSSGFHNIDADAPITEKLMYGLEVAGIGMMVVVSPENVEKAIESLKATGEDVAIIGKIVAGDKKVILK